jgi:hypothetical protein
MTSPAPLAALVLVSLASAAAAEAPDGTAQRMALAQRIYREGVLPSGEPVRAVHPGGGTASGAQAACVMCHRRSGMGTVEGTRVVLPITGQFLYEVRPETLADLDLRLRRARGPDFDHALGMNRARVPYTDQTLVRAIREGVNAAGDTLGVMMPRYQLSDGEAQLLVDYLKQLSKEWSPGVTQDTIRFATVVTPDVDPVRRKAMLGVLHTFFDIRNTRTRLEKLRDQPYPGSQYKTYRSWELQVWDLTGGPENWEAQLAADYQKEPVFALISGASQGVWAPVHEFCEKQGVPCWFPTVDLPVVSDTDYYPVYFSAGVLLEANLLARQLHEEREKGRVKRVIQVRGDDAVSAAAAKTVRRALAGAGILDEERVLRMVDPAALREATADLGREDALVFWLHGADVAKLAEVPAPASAAYFSAILTGGEHAPLPPAWRTLARMVYPFELPDKRRANMAYTYISSWFKKRGLPLVDERVQADAYLACALMAEKLDEMQENLYRDYLMESAEDVISKRLATAMYHHLGLGPGQRFASKGGYIVRFAGPDSPRLVAETDWTVP